MPPDGTLNKCVMTPLSVKFTVLHSHLPLLYYYVMH